MKNLRLLEEMYERIEASPVLEYDGISKEDLLELYRIAIQLKKEDLGVNN